MKMTGGIRRYIDERRGIGLREVCWMNYTVSKVLSSRR